MQNSLFFVYIRRIERGFFLCETEVFLLVKVEKNTNWKTKIKQKKD